MCGSSFCSALGNKGIGLGLPGILLFYPVALLHTLENSSEVRAGAGVGFVLIYLGLGSGLRLCCFSSFFRCLGSRHMLSEYGGKDRGWYGEGEMK